MTTCTSPPDGATVLDVPTTVRALGRLAAVLAIGSAAVHLLLADGADLGSLAMLAMALVCLPCAWHLWRRPTGTAWAVTATVDAAMLVLHLQMLAPQAGHVHGSQGSTGLLELGLSLVAAQLVTACLAAFPRRAAGGRSSGVHTTVAAFTRPEDNHPASGAPSAWPPTPHFPRPSPHPPRATRWTR